MCGWGHNVRLVSRPRRSDDWEMDCDPGPVRVAVHKRNGQVRDLRTYVGGRWREREGITDVGEVPAAEAVEYLVSVAETVDGEPGAEAVMAIAIAADVSVWPILARLARDEDRPGELRGRAVFWLGEFPDDGVVDVLVDILESEAVQAIKDQAIHALSRHDSDRSQRLLRAIAMDHNAVRHLRERAVFWLGQTRREANAEFLRDLYGELEETTLRERVIFSLSQMRGMNDAWLLELALDDGEPRELREKAIFWVGQSQTGMQQLLDLYDRLSSRILRERVIFGLSQRRRDVEAVEQLMEIAQSDPDRELRGKAIFWLGQSRHPRAVQFLAELIRR